MGTCAILPHFSGCVQLPSMDSPRGPLGSWAAYYCDGRAARKRRVRSRRRRSTESKNQLNNSLQVAAAQNTRNNEQSKPMDAAAQCTRLSTAPHHRSQQRSHAAEGKGTTVDVPQRFSINAVKNRTARSQLLGGKYKEPVVFFKEPIFFFV